MIILPLFFVMAIGFCALAGWAYNLTDNLFLVGLLHAAGNAATGGSGFGEGFLARLYGKGWVPVLHTLAAFVIGLALIAATRGRLGSRTPGTSRSSRGCFERRAVSWALVRCGPMTGAGHIGPCR